MNLQLTSLRYGVLFGCIFLATTMLAAIAVHIEDNTVLFTLGFLLPFLSAVVVTSLAYFRNAKNMIKFNELVLVSLLGVISIEATHFVIGYLNPGMYKVASYFAGSSGGQALLLLIGKMICCMMFIWIALKCKTLNSVRIGSHNKRTAYYSLLFTAAFALCISMLALLKSPPLAALALGAIGASMVVTYLFIRHHGRPFNKRELRDLTLGSTLGFASIAIVSQGIAVDVTSLFIGATIAPLFIATSYYGAMDQMLNLGVRSIGADKSH